ncbi:MAG: SAM-dependent methyltransferase [Campylobacterota bacterium]
MKNKYRELFNCSDETFFYEKCLKQLIFKNKKDFQTIVEFGSGDGVPVLNAVCSCNFTGTIYGFEYNSKAYEILQKNIKNVNLEKIYHVKNQSFFEAKLPKAKLLIANPPYIPYSSNAILLPHLWGGEKGCKISKDIISYKIPNIMIIVASYSNPIELIEYATSLGYIVKEFLVTNMPYGVYSNEPKVKDYINKLATKNSAFFHKDYYKVAGVLFQKNSDTLDKKQKLIANLTTF